MKVRQTSTEQLTDYSASRLMDMAHRGGAADAQPQDHVDIQKNAPGHATTPAGGESGGRLHGRLGGEEPDRVSTVANDP